jgi:hypothetical protein
MMGTMAIASFRFVLLTMLALSAVWLLASAALAHSGKGGETRAAHASVVQTHDGAPGAEPPCGCARDSLSCPSACAGGQTCAGHFHAGCCTCLADALSTAATPRETTGYAPQPAAPAIGFTPEHPRKPPRPSL